MQNICTNISSIQKCYFLHIQQYKWIAKIVHTFSKISQVENKREKFVFCYFLNEGSLKYRYANGLKVDILLFKPNIFL